MRFATLLISLLASAANAQIDAGIQVSPVLNISGYVEAFYQFGLGPDAVQHRAFDAVSNSFTISNVVLDGKFEYEGVFVRLALQVGLTPDIYYASESPPANQPPWKFIQQANVGYEFSNFFKLRIEAGIFLSPVGPESMAVKDNYNFSRSNLFYTLPFFHTGIRASVPFLEKYSFQVAVYNGWNSVIDNNAEKTFSAQFLRTDATSTLSFLYMVGVEDDAVVFPSPLFVSRSIRNLFDLHYTTKLNQRLDVILHVNAGFEIDSPFRWFGAAVNARVKLLNWLFLSPRIDFYAEERRISEPSAIAGLVGSSLYWTGTVTAEFKPHSNVSLRVEYRHDSSASPRVSSAGFVINTLTLGITTWL